MLVAVAVTVRLMAWVLVTPPPVAVTVSVALVAVAVEDAVKVKVLAPPPGAAMLVGEKLAVTPLESPLIDNPTDELNPFTRPVARLRWAELPRPTLMLVALGDKVKLGVNTVKPRV